MPSPRRRSGTAPSHLRSAPGSDREGAAPPPSPPHRAPGARPGPRRCAAAGPQAGAGQAHSAWSPARTRPHRQATAPPAPAPSRRRPCPPPAPGCAPWAAAAAMRACHARVARYARRHRTGRAGRRAVGSGNPATRWRTTRRTMRRPALRPGPTGWGGWGGEMGEGGGGRRAGRCGVRRCGRGRQAGVHGVIVLQCPPGAGALRRALQQARCQNRAMQFFKDLSLSTAVAGFVAVLVGFTSSVAIVFQAAQAFGATPAQISSWVWALGLGSGLCSLVPSLILRQPVMVAWSTPGAAVLATAGLAGGFDMAQAVGAFMASAVLITLAGITGWFERVMNRIPMEIATALLAGVLARFGLQAFVAAQTALPLVLLMLLVYLLSRRLAARYAVVITLAVAVVYVASQGRMAWSAVTLELAQPIFTAPRFSVAAIVSLAIPLFVVTMASQNLP